MVNWFVYITCEIVFVTAVHSYTGLGTLTVGGVGRHEEGQVSRCVRGG